MSDFSKPVLATLAGQVAAHPPCWFMRQAGRYLPEYRETRAKAGGFLDLCLNPELAAEVTLQPIRRYGMDAAILFADILIIPHALGQSLAYLEGEGPRLEPIRSRRQVLTLDWDHAAERWQPVLETVRRVKAALPAETTLIGFAGAPWTVAAYMVEGQGSRDWAEAKAFAWREPDAFHDLVMRLVATTADYLSQQIKAGAEVVQIFDSWAGALPADLFRHLVIGPTRALVGILRNRHPGIPVIGFPRGAGALLPIYVADSGVDAVSLDTSVPIAWARRKLGPKLPVQGNLDPVLLVVGGPPMRSAALQILDQVRGHPFIFNLGHGILQTTPPDHLADLIRVIRSSA